MTAYDRETHALIRNVSRASRASNRSPSSEEPGRIGRHLFRAGSAGRAERNWIPTDPERGFELMFRLYAPTKALFEKTWTLPDVEAIAAQ